jgi:hypothetical protein
MELSLFGRILSTRPRPAGLGKNAGQATIARYPDFTDNFGKGGVSFRDTPSRFQ